MLRCFLAVAVCVLSSVVAPGVEVAEESVTPLIAPKPLLPLEQIDGPLPDDYVIAKLDGQPIRLSELLESRGYTEQLQILRKKVTPKQFRSTQERLLKRDLKPYLELRLCAGEFQSQLSKEQNDKINRALHRLWQDEVIKLQARYEVKSMETLEEQLKQRGTQ